LVNHAYRRIVNLAANGGVPCVVLDSYRLLRMKQSELEAIIRDAAKAAGIMVPEDAPRSLGMFGGCSPGDDEVNFTPEAIMHGRAYIAGVDKRAHVTDNVLRELWRENAFVPLGVTSDNKPFGVKARDQFKFLLDQLAPFARAGTRETSPSPHNLSLLRLIYYCGGTAWPISEGEKLRMLDVPLDQQAPKVVFAEANALDEILDDFFSSRGLNDAGEPSGDVEDSKSKWLWIGGGVTTALTVGVGVATWYFGRKDQREQSSRREMFDPRERDAGYGDDDGYDDEPRMLMAPPKKRRKKRKARVIKAPVDAETGLTPIESSIVQQQGDILEDADEGS
jgi:hypothetical protein